MPTVVHMGKSHDEPRDNSGLRACRTHRIHAKASLRTQERQFYCLLNVREMAEDQGPALGFRGAYRLSVLCRSCSRFQCAIYLDL